MKAINITRVCFNFLINISSRKICIQGREQEEKKKKKNKKNKKAVFDSMAIKKIK